MNEESAEQNMSIFRKFKNKEDKDKRYWLIHGAFKKKFFVPIAFFMDKWLRKVMVDEREDIPNKPQNKNFLILWDSFEKGLKTWHTNFYRKRNKVGGEITNKKEMRAAWRNRHKLHWYKIPKFFLKLMLTIILEDTAYREMLNCMLYELQARMNRQYKVDVIRLRSKQEATEELLKSFADILETKPTTVHPMYTNKFDMDIAYFVEWMRVSGQTGQVIINVEKPKSEEVEGSKSTETDSTGTKGSNKRKASRKNTKTKEV